MEAFPLNGKTVSFVAAHPKEWIDYWNNSGSLCIKDFYNMG